MGRAASERTASHASIVSTMMPTPIRPSAASMACSTSATPRTIGMMISLTPPWIARSRSSGPSLHQASIRQRTGTVEAATIGARSTGVRGPIWVSMPSTSIAAR